MCLHGLLSNPTPVSIQPAHSLTPPERENNIPYGNHFCSGDITLHFTPGLSAPQPAGLYHMSSDLLNIILQKLDDFATLWNSRRVCLEFFRLVMGDTKSNELFLNTIRRSKVPINFLHNLGKGFRLRMDNTPMMMLMVNNYNRSLWSLFRMMYYHMLMDLSLYDEDVVFYKWVYNADGSRINELCQHPFTLPVLSLQSIIPKLGVTMDTYMASIFERGQNETDAELISKKDFIVRAIIASDSWNAFGTVVPVFSGPWSHDMPSVLAQYEMLLDDWLDDPNNHFLVSRLEYRQGRHNIRTHPSISSGHVGSTKTLWVTPPFSLEAVIEGDYPFPLFEFFVGNRSSCMDSIGRFRSAGQCLQRIGCMKETSDPLGELGAAVPEFEAGVRNFVNSMIPTLDNIAAAVKNKTAPGLLNLYIPQGNFSWTKTLCYQKRSTLFPVLAATYSSSMLDGSELLLMLKKLYGLPDESDIWTQFINSKRGVYAPDKAITIVDNSRPGHRDKRMKKRSRGIFDDFRMSLLKRG
jgi:hypothetical protein